MANYNRGRYYGGTGDPYSRQGRGMGTSRFKIFLILGVGMALFHVFKYYTNTQTNTITGEKQRVNMSQEQEIQLGLASAPQMIQQYGGLYQNKDAQDIVSEVGDRLIKTTIARQTGYPYDFYLLADPKVVNAFALPGGQVFITSALFNQFGTEDELAGVLGHEIGHVIHRHGAERMASAGLINGLISSVLIGSGGSQSMAQIANVVGQYGSMKYGRDQELESDDFGVRLMLEAGYNPDALLNVMDILEQSSSDKKQPEFMSSHPSPSNRREEIKESIDKYTRKQGN